MGESNHKLDYDLVGQLHKGNVEAFDQIFNKYGNRLFGFALSYLKNREEAECLVQDVFLKIWENRKKVKHETSLKSYLFTIAYHELCHIFRKKQIHENFLVNKKSTSDLTVNMEEQMEYKATLEQVDKLIEQLPEKKRTIFIKSKKEGKSTKEIAKEMNLSPGTVDNQISSALKFIRSRISKNNFMLLLLFALFIQ
jgi:RNA polymerase sigma-70 factor (ECF subfamily)